MFFWYFLWGTANLGLYELFLGKLLPAGIPDQIRSEIANLEKCVKITQL